MEPQTDKSLQEQGDQVFSKRFHRCDGPRSNFERETENRKQHNTIIANERPVTKHSAFAILHRTIMCVFLETGFGKKIHILNERKPGTKIERCARHS